MTDTPDLREQIASLFRSAPGEERLGDQTPGEIADAVLAELPKGWDRFVRTIQLLRDRLADTTTERDAAQGELERLHSWAGLMELLDEHWPADIFPGPENGAVEREDDGPRVVSLIRAIDKLGASRRDWAAEAMALQLQLDARLCTGDHACLSPVHIPGCFYSDTESPEHPDFASADTATPDEWSERLGIRVHDPDGWRNDGKAWDDPLTEAEFVKRASISTTSGWAGSVHPDSNGGA